MEQRLKERLTGAAILVALVVLIVPELFHGDRGERASKEAASSEGPPLRSYTIDLGGSHTAPMQLTSSEPHAAAPAAAAPAADLSPVATSSANMPNANAAAPAAAASTSAAIARTAPTHGSPAAAPSSSAQAHAERYSSRAPVETAPAEHATANPAEWTVQLGLYSQRANAERMVHTAQGKGFSASLSKPDAKGRYRVRVAGIANRSAALTLVARMHAAGLPAAAVGPQ